MAWATDETEKLKKYFPTSSINELEKLFPNYNKKQIKARATYLKLKKDENYVPNKNKEWEDDELKILKENYSSSTMEELLLLLPNKDKEQIRRRAVYNKLKKDEEHSIEIWDENEIKILKMYYDVSPMDELLKKLPNKNERQILSRARHENLKKDKDFVDQYRLEKMMQGRKNIWSKEEDATLIKYIEDEGVEAVSEMLENRTVDQVKVRARTLGIDYYKNKEEWKEVKRYTEPTNTTQITIELVKRRM